MEWSLSGRPGDSLSRCVLFLIVSLFYLHAILSKNQTRLKHVPNTSWGSYLRASMSPSERASNLKKVRQMFDFAYDSYMKHAFPLDELNPINCTGRGYDHENPDNVNVNDALGDFHLGLIDSLDTLAVMGKTEEFKSAVNFLSSNLSFDHDVRVQVFEATIRVIGGLLSAHLMMTDSVQLFGPIRPDSYDGELLTHAHDLANRMLHAFHDSPSGIPFPRFRLKSGMKDNATSEACLAGAGSLLIEFGSLSALLGDPTFADVSRKAVLNLWSRRSGVTGLLGSTIDVKTGKWINRMSGLGAGLDSFYEYLHKSHVLFADRQMGKMFEEILGSLRYHLRSNESECLTKDGHPSVYWNVDMYTGSRVNTWIDSLQAVWPGILAHHGDVREAVCQHAVHYFIWRIYGFPPERYDLMTEKPQLYFYPLRPEFAESTYFLYRATRHPFYLHVGELIMNNIDKHAKAACGFATIHNVLDKSQEDRMESFFLSETLKYLYLLFDEDNPVNRNELDYVFSTQGHLFPVQRLRSLIKDLASNPFQSEDPKHEYGNPYTTSQTCLSFRLTDPALPLEESTWNRIGKFVKSNIDTHSPF